MNRKETIANNEISELCTLSLGGYQQKVLIEGKYENLPIVITLHGGPGTPIPMSVGCRGMFPEFTDKFIMVFWDQLGCGINNYVIDDTFTIDKFVKMTEDLINEIKTRFPKNKIFIFSTSWGSILSVKLLENNPRAVDGVIANGQIIKNVFICDEVRNTLAQTNIPNKKLERIKNVTLKNYTEKDLQLISKSLMKYTDAYQNKKGEKAPMGTIIKGLVTSSDYRFKDFKAIMVNGYMKNTSLWKEILNINLSEKLCGVQIPYTIIQGDTDIVASTNLVQELVANCNNPNLSCQVVADTGHYPSVNLMEYILELLLKWSRM